MIFAVDCIYKELNSNLQRIDNRIIILKTLLEKWVIVHRKGNTNESGTYETMLKSLPHRKKMQIKTTSRYHISLSGW